MLELSLLDNYFKIHTRQQFYCACALLTLLLIFYFLSMFEVAFCQLCIKHVRMYKYVCMHVCTPSDFVSLVHPHATKITILLPLSRLTWISRDLSKVTKETFGNCLSSILFVLYITKNHTNAIQLA